MGCDIHIVVERKRAGEPWIGLYTTDVCSGPRIPVAQRDYDFFAEVASVRGSSKNSHYPRNVPKDVSQLAWDQYMQSPTDHHSASWMPLTQFATIHNQINPKRSRADHCVYDLFGVDSGWPEDCEYRAVFWFDN